MTPKIWIRILWSRPKLEYPKEECPPWEFPLSVEGARLFEKEWPVIRQQLGQAIKRGFPPEEPTNGGVGWWRNGVCKDYGPR